MKLSVPLVRWILGVFFVLSALVELSEKAFVSGIASVLLASLLIPPAAKAIFASIKRPVPTIARGGLGVVLFFLVVATASSSTKKSEPTPAPSPQQESTSPTPTSSPETSPQPSPSPESTKQQATLLRVVDGDTIEVSIDGKKETIRIIGVNAPETVDPRKSAECFGKEASDQAKYYFKQSGKDVWINNPRPYGRGFASFKS